MAVSYAAFHVPRFNAARFRNVIPFPERAGASTRESRRTVLPRAAETQGALCGKDRKHAGTGRSFRRGVAAPTLVRESSQVGMVFGGLDRRNRNPRAESARDSHHREKWRDYGHGRDRTKGRARRSGDGGPGGCDDVAE